MTVGFKSIRVVQLGYQGYVMNKDFVLVTIAIPTTILA